MRERILNRSKELFDETNHLILEFATGVGKTKIALELIKRYGGKWYILVPEVSGIKNWHKEITKFGFEDLLMNIEIFCYDSLHKYKEKQNLVLDEGHHITDKRLSFLNNLKGDKIITLSATIPLDKLKLLTSLRNPYKRFIIPLHKAVEWGLVKAPQVYLHSIELNDSDYYVYHNIYRGSKKNIKDVITVTYERYINTKYLQKKWNVHIRVFCTEKQAYSLLMSEFEEKKKKYFAGLNNPDAKSSTINWLKIDYLRQGNRIKKFLSAIKVDISAEIIKERLKDKRFICFSAAIEQSKNISKKSGYKETSIINSKVEDNQYRIDQFNSKVLSSLFVVGMLTEMANLTDIESGIIVQLDNQLKTTVQKLGRVLRSKNPEIHIVYIKDTRDEIYLKNVYQITKDQFKIIKVEHGH